MNTPLEELQARARAALESIPDPLTGQGLVSAGRIVRAQMSGDRTFLGTIAAPAEAVDQYAAVRRAAVEAVRGIAGVGAVQIALTTQREAAPAPGATRVRKGDPPPKPPPPQAPSGERRAEGIAGVGAIIAVSSAKGGVGKSTVAVNLACALADLGLRVGLLDADVYGPSAPTLLGLGDAQPAMGPHGKLIPIAAHGLKTMSIGYLVELDAPMIWRGPMAGSALRQMLDDVAWAPLDMLVIDMPPGTGDVHLTLAQRLPLSGAVIVSTPQEMALADVRRGVAMFERTHVPILGVIENMAWLEQPGGGRLYVFGEGGARRTAQASGAPFLGEIPIDVALRESADAGTPLVRSAPASDTAQRFAAIAQRLLAELEVGAKPPPVIRLV